MLGSIPVRTLVQVLTAAALLVTVTSSAWGQANRANQSQLRWYDAYDQALAAIKKADWTTAEKLLLQAQASGTKPGPRVFAYGDRYIRYFPDYQLGIVYLNTNRDREAEAAFARLGTLLQPKDPEYAAFERQRREATFNRSFEEAVALAQKGDFTTAQARLGEARATKFDDTKVSRLSQDITAEMAKLAKAQTPPAGGSPAPVQQPPPYTQAPTTAGGNIPTTVGSTPPNVASRPGVITPRADPLTPSASTVKPGPSDNETFKNPGVIQPPSPAALRNGLLAFFSGDYGAAVPLLARAAEQPASNPRAAVFLACAKVGLVLTGGADAMLLREARVDFQSANARQALSAADRRLISPRVLQQLETP